MVTINIAIMMQSLVRITIITIFTNITNDLLQFIVVKYGLLLLAPL